MRVMSRVDDNMLSVIGFLLICRCATSTVTCHHDYAISPQ